MRSAVRGVGGAGVHIMCFSEGTASQHCVTQGSQMDAALQFEERFSRCWEWGQPFATLINTCLHLKIKSNPKL